MHPLKACCISQTFPLAKSNESGGKKSRIRRSKEERKSMVESFIKTHQKLNNGDFPSLSLTHKKVGGSFYTVREIVREIIQENRVLGPAKLISEENDTDQVLEQDPSGSMLMQPVLPLSVSLNDNSHFVPDQQQVPEKKLTLIPENGQIINGSQVDVEYEESDRTIRRKSQISEPFEENGVLGSDKLNSDEQNTHQPLEQNSSGSVSAKSEVSFPVSSAGIHLMPEHDHVPGSSSPKLENQRLENKENKAFKKTVCWESKATEPFEVEKMVKEVSANKSEAPKLTEDMTETRVTVTDVSMNVVVETFPLRPVTTIADFMDGQLAELKNSSESLIGNEIERADFGAANDGVKSVDPVGIAPASSGLLEEKAEEARDAPSVEIANAAQKEAPETVTDSLLMSSRTVEPNQPAVNIEDTTTKGNKALLNRTKPGSWDEACNNAAGPEANPLLEIFKSWVTAFVRFWSE